MAYLSQIKLKKPPGGRRRLGVGVREGNPGVGEILTWAEACIPDHRSGVAVTVVVPSVCPIAVGPVPVRPTNRAITPVHWHSPVATAGAGATPTVTSQDDNPCRCCLATRSLGVCLSSCRCCLRERDFVPLGTRSHLLVCVALQSFAIHGPRVKRGPRSDGNHREGVTLAEGGIEGDVLLLRQSGEDRRSGVACGRLGSLRIGNGGQSGQ